MTLRTVAAEAWTAEKEALEAERIANEAQQAERDRARREQRYRSANAVVGEVLAYGDGYAFEVERVEAPLACDERSVGYLIDDVLLVWTEASSRGVAARQGKTWEVSAGSNGILELWGPCGACGDIVAWGMVVDLADIGRLLEAGAPASHQKVWDDGIEAFIDCNADGAALIEARAARMEADARAQAPRCSVEERRLLDTLDELYGRF